MKTKTEIQSNTRTHALTVNKLAIIMVSALTLIGCATSNEITLPDGGQGYSIECPTGVSRTACLQKLSDTCPNGYDLFNATQDSHQGLIYNPYIGGYQTINNSSMNMVVKCH